MPKDEALYLSKLHAGEQIACEAAEAFYKHNIFSFGVDATSGSPWVMSPNPDGWSMSKLDHFFDHDYFGSGLTPRDYIRKIRLYLHGPMGYSFRNFGGDSAQGRIVADHMTFEQAYSNSSVGFDHRKQMQYFSELHSLQEVTTVAPAGGELDQLLRILNPSVHEMIVKGIKVRLQVTELWDHTVVSEPSKMFVAEVAEEDYCLFEKIAGRKFIECNDQMDPLETWWKWLSVQGLFQTADTWGDHNLGFIRVWLLEHYYFYQWFKAHEKLILEWTQMKEELSSMTTESRAVRRDYYTRMIDLIQK